MWVRLNSYRNERGWFMHTDDGGYDRSILMHDTRYGKDSNGSFMGRGVGVHRMTLAVFLASLVRARERLCV